MSKKMFMTKQFFVTLLVLSFMLVLLNQATLAAGWTFDIQDVGDTTGSDVDDVWVGDFNGDTRLDFVITDSALRWHENNGGSPLSFTAHQIDGSNYMGTAVGDYDGDGDLDVSSGSKGGSYPYYWWENDGSGGGWTRHDTGASGDYWDNARSWDFNGDGRDDLVIEHYGGDNIYYCEAPVNKNNAWNCYRIGSSDGGLCIGDTDGDGDKDVISGDKIFTTPANPAQANWSSTNVSGVNGYDKCGVGNLNGDANADIAFSQGEGTTVKVVFGPGWTSSHTVFSSGNGLHSMHVEDFDQDGDDDLFTAEIHGSGRTFLFENADGTGTSWNTHEQIQGDASGTHNGWIGDFDGDGMTDLIGKHYTGGQISIWYNTLTPPEWSLDDWQYKQVSSSHELVFGLTSGDVDGDGDWDILSGRYWYTNPGGDMTGTWTQNDFGVDVDALLVTNVDDDADFDVISMASNGDLKWLETSDGGSSWNSTTVGNMPSTSHGISSQGYKLAQIVPGGKPEVVASNDPGDIYYWEISGTSWPRTTICSGSNCAHTQGIGVGDIDADGNIDVAGVSNSGGQIAWFKNPGDGSANWAHYDIAVTWTSWPDRIETADVNGDNKPDIIVGEEGGGKFYWAEQPADPTSPNWAKHVIEDNDMFSLDVADLDNDGDLDLSSGDHKNPKVVAVWENDGSGNFTEHQVDTGKESHMGARLFDLDQDGDKDIISICYDDSQYVHMWRNDGGGGSMPTAATPSISPNGGSFEGSVEVTLSTSTSGADIYYTTDGSDPTQSDTQYIFPFHLNAPFDGTIKARAFKDGFNPSEIANANFTVTTDTVAPTISSVTAKVATEVEIVFNEPVDQTSAETVGNYAIDNGITVNSAVLQADGVTVKLGTSTLSESVTYTLTATGVEDLAGNPSNDSETFQLDTIPTDGLISRWLLDESSGTTAADSWGSNNGTLVGNPVWQPSGGKYDGALDFDGSGDLIDIGNMDIAGGSGLTIAMWIKANSFPGDTRFISKATGTGEQDHYWMVSKYDNNSVRFRLKTNGSTTTLVGTSNTIGTGQWYHVAVTYDGSQMRIYVDGNPAGSTSKSGAVATSASAPAAIGAQPQNNNNFDGLLDEVYIYNRALSEAEIETLMDGGGTPPPPNQAPVANAGPDQSVETNTLVTLDGSSSYDPDPGDTISYSWAQTSGPSVSLSDPSAVQPTFTPSVAGTYIFELTVDDGDLNDTDSVTITVTDTPPPNQAPVADAGADQSVETNTLVTLDGSGSYDPDPGDTISYSWAQTSGPSVSLSDPSAVQPTFTPSVADTYIFELTVDDGDLNDTDSVTITVTDPPNQAPVADAGPDQSVNTNTLVTLDGSGSYDPDPGDTISYSWAQTSGPSVTLSDPNAVQPTFTPSVADTYVFELTVDDGDLDDSDSVTITVTEPPAGGLISHWLLDESSGLTANDSAGSNDGTLVNGPVWQPAGGHIGGALEFDGSNDRVDLGNMDISGGDGLTIACWIKADSFPGDTRFVSKATGTAANDHYWMVSKYDNNSVRFRLKTNGSTTTLIGDSNTIGTGQWYHVAVTYDGSQMRIYVDGSPAGSTSKTGAVDTNASVPAALGANPQGNNYFDGLLDDVRIYNRALSQAEVQNLANQ